MDVDQIGELRAWATRLEERADSDELRAAARAILMLTEEVAELWARVAAAPPVAAAVGVEAEPAVAIEAESDEATRGENGTSLRSRIRRSLGLD